MWTDPDRPPQDHLAPPDVAARLRADSATWPDVVLSPEDLDALELIATGVLHPLTGFMRAAEATAVDRGEPVGPDLPAPVVLAVAADRARVGAVLALRDAEGDLLARLDVEEVFTLGGRTCVAGDLVALQRPVRHDHVALRRSPAEAAVVHGRPPVLVTDRPPDAAQLDAAGPDALVLVVDRPPGPGVAPVATVVRALRAAGVHEPVVVPRPPGADLAAWTPALAAAYGSGPAAPPDPHHPGRVPDDVLRDALAVGDVPGGPAFGPAVQAELRAAFPPPDRVGVTILLTGLSGSGKSTVANALAALLPERTPRRTTLLDGDLVRTHLSSELGFSREHRDLNVTRIGFVAAEVTRHGGIAICAPIAPYASTRAVVRRMVEAVGRFVLVHVATPLEVCEARDRKGLYAKARAGLIDAFTGISDPYEVPEDADVVIDTSTGTVRDAAEAVLAHLEARGLIGPPPSG